MASNSGTKIADFMEYIDAINLKPEMDQEIIRCTNKNTIDFKFIECGHTIKDKKISSLASVKDIINCNQCKQVNVIGPKYENLMNITIDFVSSKITCRECERVYNREQPILDNIAGFNCYHNLKKSFEQVIYDRLYEEYPNSLYRLFRYPCNKKYTGDMYIRIGDEYVVINIVGTKNNAKKLRNVTIEKVNVLLPLNNYRMIYIHQELIDDETIEETIDAVVEAVEEYNEKLRTICNVENEPKFDYINDIIEKWLEEGKKD